MKPWTKLIPIVLVPAMLIAISTAHKRSAPASFPQAAGVEYTSYSAAEHGTKALYLLLEKLGYSPKRLRMSYLSGTRAEGLAIILAPDQPVIDGTDAKRLLEWLRQGNTLLFAPGKREDQLSKSLRIKLRRGQPLEASIAPLAFTNLTAGIQRLAVRSGNRVLTRRTDAVRHFGDTAGEVVISLREGTGTVVILSDPYLMTNVGLLEGGNLGLLVNTLLAYAADTRTVYFDEYHHGFGRRLTVFHLLKGTSLGWALLQVAAAAVLLMYSRGRRFGQPKPPRTREEAHRSSVEHITSLAGIYRTARASGVALSNLYERLLRSVRTPTFSGSITDLRDEWKKKAEEGEVSDKDLIDLARRMESARHPRRGR